MSTENNQNIPQQNANGGEMDIDESLRMSTSTIIGIPLQALFVYMKERRECVPDGTYSAGPYYNLIVKHDESKVYLTLVKKYEEDKFTFTSKDGTDPMYKCVPNDGDCDIVAGALSEMWAFVEWATLNHMYSDIDKTCELLGFTADEEEVYDGGVQ